jgi:hypothetical protein
MLPANLVQAILPGMTSSKKEASKAGADLRDPKTPKKDRGPIASDLSQAKPKKK